MKREMVSTGTEWELVVGYSRAVRVGPHVFVSGTTATDAAGRVVAIGDDVSGAGGGSRRVGSASRLRRSVRRPGR